MSRPKLNLFAAGLFAVLFASPCMAQDGKPVKGTITTTGSATVEVKPDTVRITFGSQVRLTGLKEARAENDRQAKKLSDALTALKIENLKIVATTSSVQVTMTANAGGAPGLADVPLVPSGYQLTTSFTVTGKANDIEKLRDIAKRVGDAALENGANVPADGAGSGEMFFGGGGGFPRGMQPSRVFAPGVEILREDTTDDHNKALSAAVKNAVLKAEALAIGAGTKNLKIIAISDDAITTDGLGSRGPAGRGGLGGLLLGGYGPEPSPTITTTSLTVRVRVTCSFE